MKKKLKGIALMCSLILGITLTSNTVPAHAETINEKTNFKILINESEKVIYTYEENGKSYRVEENIDSKNSKVDSIIYEINKNELIPISTIKTSLDNNNLIVKTTKKNKTTMEIVDLNSEIQINNNMDTMISPRLHEPGAGSGSTNWQYWGTIKSSTAIVKYTIGAVKVAIQAIVASKSTTPVQAAAVAACGYIAGVIIESRIPTVYYTKEFYNSYYVGSNLLSGEKVISTFYSDSARKNKIDTAIDFYWN